MTISESIIKWLKEFNPTEYWKMQQINTDQMQQNVDYALVKEPVQNVKTFISGNKVITEHYQLRARLASCCDEESVDNGAWLELLSEWINKRDKKREYPQIQDGEVQQIGIASPFYMGKTSDNKAIYQLTIFIRYMKKGETQ